MHNVCRSASTVLRVYLMNVFSAQRVTDLLQELPEYKRAGNLSVYLSMPQGELSTNLIVRDSFSQGKGVYVPHLYKPASAEPGSPKSLMDMVSLHSEADYEALEPDAWGIPSPNKDSIVERKQCLGGEEKRIRLDGLDLIIMPGVAFDNTLARLGHGKGFYDFFLQRYQQQIISDKTQPKMPFLGKTISAGLP